MENQEDYNSVVAEYKLLYSKSRNSDPLEGYIKGLTKREYVRINVLHGILLETLEGQSVIEKREFFKKL